MSKISVPRYANFQSFHQKMAGKAPKQSEKYPVKILLPSASVFRGFPTTTSSCLLIRDVYICRHNEIKQIADTQS